MDLLLLVVDASSRPMEQEDTNRSVPSDMHAPLPDASTVEGLQLYAWTMACPLSLFSEG